MVRRGIADRKQREVTPRVDFRFDWAQLWQRHEAYWSLEAIARRAKFVEIKNFQVPGGPWPMRVVCDGQSDGKDCGNVIGYQDTYNFETHDGLCNHCRHSGVDFPPRFTLTADGLYAMLENGPGIVPRPWKYPPAPPADAPPPMEVFA